MCGFFGKYVYGVNTIYVRYLEIEYSYILFVKKEAWGFFAVVHHTKFQHDQYNYLFRYFLLLFQLTKCDAVC